MACSHGEEAYCLRCNPKAFYEGRHRAFSLQFPSTVTTTAYAPMLANLGFDGPYKYGYVGTHR